MDRSIYDDINEFLECNDQANRLGLAIDVQDESFLVEHRASGETARITGVESLVQFVDGVAFAQRLPVPTANALKQ